MAERVFLNDKLVEAHEAYIPATDSGFLYGAGLFETLRSHNGVVFRLEDHLDRLLLSAASLSIQPALDKAFLTEAVYDVLRGNELTDARLRLTLTNGPLANLDEPRQPTLLITATKRQPYPPEYYQNGAMVVLCPYRQSSTYPLYGHKTTCYYARLLALSLAHQKQAAEALWFTDDHRLAEGCVSNVFLVKDSVLLTPPVETPVLPGIARKTLCQIAGRVPVELVEKDLHIADLLEADEVFLTNVIMEVLPVVGVEQHTIAEGKVGPITRTLREAFLQTIEDECRRHE